MTDDPGTVRWWGEPWGAPINDPRAMVPTPIHETCAHCGHPIRDGDQGVTVPHAVVPPSTRVTSSWHLRCWLLTTVGAVGVAALEDRSAGDAAS